MRGCPVRRTQARSGSGNGNGRGGRHQESQDGDPRDLQGPEPVDEVPERTDTAATPEEHAVRRDDVARVVTAMAGLSDQQSEIIVLRVAVGLTSEETAAALGMTPGAVRVAQHRALATLRRLTAPLATGGVA